MILILVLGYFALVGGLILLFFPLFLLAGVVFFPLFFIAGWRKQWKKMN